MYQKVAIEIGAGTNDSDEEPLPADNLLAALKHLDEKQVQQQEVKKPPPQMSKSHPTSLFVMV